VPRVESAVAVGGCECADDALLLPGLEVGEEGVVGKVDVSEEDEVVSPVRSLLRSGADGDGVGGGNLSSQVSSLEDSSGGKGQMLKFDGTWSGMWEAKRWVSAVVDKSVSRERLSERSFSVPGNQVLIRAHSRSMTNAANSRAMSNCSGCVAASKFDFRSHPAAEVLSV
jgi:hypothetical protein